MVVPPKHPKMIISSRKNPWFLGKPTIFKKPPPYTRCFRIPPISGGTNEKCCFSQLDQPPGQRRYWSSPSCFWHRVSSICQDRRLHAPVSTTLLLRSVGDAQDLVVGHLVGSVNVSFLFIFFEAKTVRFSSSLLYSFDHQPVTIFLFFFIFPTVCLWERGWFVVRFCSA